MRLPRLCVKKADMTANHRFQITIRDMMAAMFWTGVSLAAWGWALRIGRLPHEGLLPAPSQFYEMLALASLGWSSMFAAIWALIGRAKKGVVIGVGMWALLLVLSLLLLV